MSPGLNKLTVQWKSLGREELRDLQGRKLRKYLRDCVLPFSKHYARTFAEAGVGPDSVRNLRDLTRLPFTSKEDLLPTPDNPRRSLDFALVPDARILGRRPSVIWRALTHGRARTKDGLEREWRPIFMTATTGRSTESVAFLYTQHDIANLGIGSGRIVDFAGIRPDDRMLNMFPFAPHLAFWYMHYAGTTRNIFALSTGGGKVMGTEGNLRAIQKVRPAVLVAMPTFAYHVLSQAVEEKIHLEGIRVICLGGEKVADGTRRKLAELCAQVGSPGARVIATYGFTEAKLAWSECLGAPGQPPSGYHLYPDMGIFEVIDPETGDVRPDGEAGELVWTPLEQRGTVVVRYRTGDYIENGITYEPCPCCGNRMPRLLGRISRVSDFRAMRFQKVKGTIVDFNELEHALDDVGGVGSWQIELRKIHDDPLERDELILHVTKLNGATEAALQHGLSAMLQSQFEFRPNSIRFHTDEEMRALQKVGIALKEQKVVDNRPKAASVPVPAPPAAVAAAQEAR